MLVVYLVLSSRNVINLSRLACLMIPTTCSCQLDARYAGRLDYKLTNSNNSDLMRNLV